MEQSNDGVGGGADVFSYVDEIDINTKKFPPVSHLVEVAPYTGERKIRVCRCWQSKKFPYCDDTHKVLVEAGDNVDAVGAFNPKPMHNNTLQRPSSQLTLQLALSRRSALLGFAAVIASAAVGYGGATFAANKKLHLHVAAAKEAIVDITGFPAVLRS